MVEGGGKDLVAVHVIVQTDDFCGVSLEGVEFCAFLDVPELGGGIHGASGNQLALGVEGHANDFHSVPLEGVQQLA